MSELLNKIASYDIFNYLFPGTLFSIFSGDLIQYHVDQSDIIGRLFLYYFVGLVISRLGSLIVEPFLKWTNFIQFCKYSDYIKASKKDQKIDTLSEANNTYRTLSTLFGLLLLMRTYARLRTHTLGFSQGWGGVILVTLLLIMFRTESRLPSSLTGSETICRNRKITFNTRP